MKRIFEIIKKHDLIEKEFFACLDVAFKKEIAEDYKISFKDYKKNPSYFQRHELKNKHFFERIERYYPAIFKDDSKNQENSFYYFLLDILLKGCFIGYDTERSSFINHSCPGSVNEFVIRHITGKEQSYISPVPILLYEQRIPSEHLSSTLEKYFDVLQQKKILPTEDALKSHKKYSLLIKKLANYDWLGIEKIEDDFEYLIASIYSLKLYVFSNVEIDFFVKKNESNKILPDQTRHDYQNQFVRFAHRLNEDKERILSIFHPNDETVEEFVVRCADYFGIKAEEEVKPVADKQTQVKEKQIVQAYSEVLKPKIEEPKAE